ncbi:hypothetical protein NC652_040872 [Populus alba x Populus x berolinensis]|nr:hypothetical protein NC651_039769 [Populus alba x Populus x berolinensis]KAJ6858421.1 hypothetical protein NC652_040872 [Populus alba x Populus x berolinensis]
MKSSFSLKLELVEKSARKPRQKVSSRVPFLKPTTLLHRRFSPRHLIT